MVDDFIDRKHGRKKVEYTHPSLEPILEGHLRRHRLPGAGHADRAGRWPATRSAAPICSAARWARRSPRRWRRRRPTFLDGAKEQKVDVKIAERGLRADGDLRRLRLQPKSHSAAYGLVTYQTAYLKHHLPARVHGGPDVVRRGQHRQRRQVHRRGAGDGPRRRAARHQRVATRDFTVVVRSETDKSEEGHPLRPRRREGRRRGRGRGSSRRRATRAGRSDRCSSSASASTRASATARCSSSWSRRARSTASPRRTASRAPGCSARIDVGVRARGRGAARARERPDLAVRPVRRRRRSGNARPRACGRGHVSRRRGVDAQAAARVREGVARLLHHRPPARSLPQRDPRFTTATSPTAWRRASATR